MASSVTLAQMRLDARLYADQRPGSSNSFISEAELTRLVNLKIRELYDLLVSARGLGYYTTETTLSIEAGTKSYDLPADFYELEAIVLEWNDRDHEALDPLPTNKQRPVFANWAPWDRYSPKAYKLKSTQVEFFPAPQGSVTARMYYVPVFVDLVNDADTFDGINGWEKMVSVGVAIEMLAIDKRVNGTLQAKYDEQLARIMEMKDERDAESPKVVVDVSPEGYRGRRRRLPMLGVFDDTFDWTFD